MISLINLLFWPAIAAVIFAARKHKILWPLLALALLLLFDNLFTKNFFHLEIRDGHLYGSRVDILNQGAKVMLISLGMTLVIATGGVDLSVGAVMAMAGAVAARMIHNGHPVGLAISLAVIVSIIAGAWNGALVAYIGIQPIIATLILMVAGRGIAQLVTGGNNIDFNDPTLVFMGNGHFLGLPFTLTIVLFMLAVTFLLTRRTALGLFIEAVGDNPTASRYAGVNSRLVTFLAYTFTGLCAGLAGLVAASNIKTADSNHAGLYLELDGILAVVVGGTALTGGRFYLVGSLIGALFIQTLSLTLVAQNVSSDIAPMPKALVIIAVCLLQSERVRRFFQGVFNRRPPTAPQPALTTSPLPAQP